MAGSKSVFWRPAISHAFDTCQVDRGEINTLSALISQEQHMKAQMERRCSEAAASAPCGAGTSGAGVGIGQGATSGTRTRPAADSQIVE